MYNLYMTLVCSSKHFGYLIATNRSPLRGSGDGVMPLLQTGRRYAAQEMVLMPLLQTGRRYAAQEMVLMPLLQTGRRYAAPGCRMERVPKGRLFCSVLFHPDNLKFVRNFPVTQTHQINTVRDAGNINCDRAV